MKYLILEYVEPIDDSVTFRIKDQSHRKYEFGWTNGIDYDRFISSNGMGLISISYPSANTIDNQIHVRGSNTDADNIICVVHIDKWNRIKEAVKEYNNYFGYHDNCIIGEVPEIMVPMEMFELD